MAAVASGETSTRGMTRHLERLLDRRLQKRPFAHADLEALTNKHAQDRVSKTLQKAHLSVGLDRVKLNAQLVVGEDLGNEFRQ